MHPREFSLPEEYSYVQYISTVENDLCYIDTEFGDSSINPQDIDIEVKFATYGGMNNVSAAVFGCRQATNIKEFTALASGATPTNFNVRFRNASSVSNVNNNSYARKTIYTLKLISSKTRKDVYMNDALLGYFAISKNSPSSMIGSMYVLACNDNNTAASNTNGVRVLYYFKMWYESTLVRDMIPVQRKEDGKLGVYDKITNKFYTSPNGHNFIM